MKEFKVGKKYKSRNNENSINIIFEVKEIKNGRLVVNIIKNNSNPFCLNGVGIRTFNYDLNSMLVKNSEEII